MTSFGRLQAALASATNELTIAAANINFDFTLVKCEAPKEFQPLGSTLSKKRKENAEGGTAHITARRLGVLFEGILPPTPNLVKSYGTRVSEIAQSVGQGGSSNVEESLFAAHVGADGTSIWAAATSSPTALHVQLLACMLGRLWTASEATSIWVELVKERRKQIEVKWNDEEPLPFSTVAAAAQSDISRASLAEWDASVRAWLRTADRFNKQRQDKLMDLLDKVNLPINHDTVYSSVMAAWKSAVETMENIIKGMPQAVNDGSCLLALSAWHLYPDITVGESDTLPLQFSDPLIQSGGFLTLGLVRPRNGYAHGVFWSLSLAHLNFYGRPVPRKARFDTDSRKISFDQFTQAVYGALLAHWGLQGPLAEHPSRIIVAMRKTIERQGSNDLLNKGYDEDCLRGLRDPSFPLNILSKVAAAYLDAQHFPSDIIHKLMALGGRRSSKFIPSRGLRSFLGLGEVGDLLSKLKGPMERVALLRRIACSCSYDPDAYIIRYFDKFYHPRFISEEPMYCGFASAQPRRSLDGLTSTHGQWVPRSYIEKYSYPGEVVTEMDASDSSHLSSPSPIITMTAMSPNGEEVMQEFHLVCGSERSAAIFMQRNTTSNATLHSAIRPLMIQDIEWCLESDFFATDTLIDLLCADQTPSSFTLRALSIAHKFYRTLPDAAISTRSLESPLYDAKWAKSLIDSEPYQNLVKFDALRRPIEYNLSNSLSCVSYLEGGFDLEPESLERLTCDPWDSPHAHELKRFTGNVGRSGLTLLIPPKTSMVMEREEMSWRLMSSSEFDGKSLNAFSKTSMHLSFTNYHVPLIQSDDVQEQSSQVFLLESVVSVYDAGHWIGDVDVLKCLTSPFIIYMSDSGCHGSHINHSFAGVLSLETWDEVLDPPISDCVVRAQGSWLARLAILTIFVEARGEAREAHGELGGTRMAVRSNNTCWECAGPSLNLSDSQSQGGGDRLLTVLVPSTSRVILF
ncbi:unnamed protein product [Fusarium graminearum]|uniref:Chromosome 1, complete genome n=1 Tax=Gibberella zeae (strain ATCC MYA-4620 / CBS 123657 / FGSC 9075 / NRRL 31084 / PH-1) TaxID=229533 RepID=A0A098DBP1_GIBZE|nr:unnamed protein product [Fusarium graminearum]